MEIREPSVIQEFNSGVIKGKNVTHYQKKYSEVKNIYANTCAKLADDTCMYEVYTWEPEKNNFALLWGVTIMHPILVAKECNMTRGHFHSDRLQGEIYFGLSGTGLLIMMEENGVNFAEKVHPGSVHYINGKYAHRLVNTGDETFKVGACWGHLAGHDYETVEKNPFDIRVFKIANEIVYKKSV